MIRKETFLYCAIALPGVLLIRFFELWIRLTKGNAVFYDHAAFPWAAALEAKTAAIRDEVLYVLRDREGIPSFRDVSKEQARIVEGENWKTFFFYAYGHRIEENCNRCPETARAIATIPGVATAMFSILEPGAHITPHRGPFKGILRCHLPLLVPKDRTACAIRVRNEVRSWDEGRCLFFDDTHDHEAWNRSEEVRVVLFIDLVRDLPFPLSVLNRTMIWLIGASPFIQNLMENVNRWNRRVDDVTVAE